MAELSGAPWVRNIGYLCNQEILVLTKFSVVHPPLNVNGCELAHLLVRSPRHILFVFTLYWTSLLWSIDSCPKRASTDQCHMTVSRAPEYNSLRWHSFKSCLLTSFWLSFDHWLRSFFQRWSKPFYSYEWKRGWRWPCFDTNLLALLCKSSFSYAN